MRFFGARIEAGCYAQGMVDVVGRMTVMSCRAIGIISLVHVVVAHQCTILHRLVTLVFVK